jgi:A/G-specific adenine glycosylase
VLVSEVMLQQTQVHRVLPRYVTWMQRYPTPAACAQAPLGELLAQWQGLGYPRRAQRLHAAAQVVVERHGGRLPSTLPELQALPGVGAYTARAVLAFAFELPAAVVDTNIARVVARVTAQRLTAGQVQHTADSWVPQGAVWQWNQSLMELGALVCRPRPDCARCPLADTCRWHRGGHQDPDPAIGTAGVSTRQARFEGSDRQARGRLLAAVLAGAVAVDDAARIMDRDAPVANRLIDGLVAEGLVARLGDELRAP